MKAYTSEDIQQMEQRQRARFINALSGYKSANLVGTARADGHPNLCMVSSVLHIGANPPLMAFISRPHSVERHTLENLRETRSFTLNQVHSGILHAGHQTSASYPRDVSEFDATGLTPLVGEVIPAPYVAESRLRVGLEYVEDHTLEVNDTILVIGRIVEVWVDPALVHADGWVDVAALEAMAVTGLDTYHTPESGTRMAYAKPDLPPREERPHA